MTRDQDLDPGYRLGMNELFDFIECDFLKRKGNKIRLKPPNKTQPFISFMVKTRSIQGGSPSLPRRKAKSTKNSKKVVLKSPKSRQIRVKRSTKIIKYPWKSRWLKGHEYLYMLKHMEQYCEELNFNSYYMKNHPESIYRKPQNGLVYFIEANHLGDEVGFPRTKFPKLFKWKKMNFPTLLPNNNPLVRYKVASSTQADKTKQPNFDLEEIYRMHIVEPHDRNFGFVLCHIRKMNKAEHMREIQCLLAQSKREALGSSPRSRRSKGGANAKVQSLPAKPQ